MPQKLPPGAVLIDPNSPSFDTIDQASRGLIATFDPKGTIEHAGAVIKGPDGKYRYTGTVTGSNDNFTMRAMFPQGHSLAAIIHSHPGEDANGQVFSPNDIDMANQLKVPSYVHFGGGEVRRFTPGVTATWPLQDSLNPHKLQRVASGDALDADPATLAPLVAALSGAKTANNAPAQPAPTNPTTTGNQ